VQYIIISELDDIYAKSLKDNFFMDLLKVSSIKMNSTKQESLEIDEENKTSKFAYCINLTMNGFYKLIKIFYSSFYFYYGPYTVLVLSMITF